jgi:hypothetical protein
MQSKRFHFVKGGSLWKCTDKMTPYIGYGKTPADAYYDWQVELEMATSDLHK